MAAFGNASVGQYLGWSLIESVEIKWVGRFQGLMRKSGPFLAIMNRIYRKCE